MKKSFFLFVALLSVYGICAQTYPEPEFSNEVYFLNKTDGYKLIRLEKTSSKMNTKNSVFGGSEQGYNLDGGKSTVRFSGGSNLSFVISDGSGGSASSASSSARSDSVMRANGIDPSMMKGITGMNDPSHAITLYKLDIEKGERKVLLQKVPGSNPFGSHKLQSSDKFSFSAKKVRDGYWEMVVDKTLPPGEYAFTVTGGVPSVDGSSVLFAFGID